MKKISLILLPVILLSMAFVLKSNNNHPILQYITTQLHEYSKNFEFESIYVQFDKPIYEPGQTIWFSAFPRNAQTFEAAESEIVYVELLNPKGAIVTTRNLLVNKNVATGDFQLGLDAIGGIYKIRAYTKWTKDVSNQLQQPIFEREITVQAVVLPTLLMELEFERKTYGAGDKPLVNLNLKTLKNKPLANKAFRYNLQLNGQTKTALTAQTNAEGNATIQLDLPLNLTTTDGLVNVMIDYQGQTESISRAIPIILNNIDVQFLPESGELLANTWNNVAFKAVNEFGKAADIEGVIYNEKDEMVTYFSSYHLGMGKFELTPEPNEQFYAKILSPKGINKKYNLPIAKKDACILKINEIQPNEIDLYMVSNLNEELYLLVENRGEVVYSEVIKPEMRQVFINTGDERAGKKSTLQNSQQLYIPTKDLPIGTSRITVINKNKEALAQRLVFLNADKQLDISIKTDKENYLPRETIEATITVKNHNGKAIQGNFAMAVADENLLTFADDKQGNILTQMLLQSELKGTIETPNFYFEPALATDKINKKQALDLLMMTQGWRRYEWKRIKEKITAVESKKEKQIIAGHLANRNFHNDGIEISIKGTDIKTKTDTNGYFEFKDVDLYDPKVLLFENPVREIERSFSINQYQDDIQLFFYPNKGLIVDQDTGEPIPFASVTINGTNSGVVSDFDGYFDLNSLLSQLKNKDIKEVQFTISYLGYNNKTFLLEDLEKNSDEIYKIYVQESLINLNSIEVTSHSNRKFQKIRKARASKKSRNRQNKPEPKRGKVNVDKFNKIYSESNDFISDKWTDNRQNKFYYKPRPFKTAQFSSLKPRVRTDFRSTIYWNGNIETDKNGIAKVQFTNVDAITTYRITIEGFGQNGEIGYHKSNVVSTMPFALRARIPTQLTDGDIIHLPITLVNNSNKKISGKLKIELPNNLKLLEKFSEKQTLKANLSRTVFVKCKAVTTGKKEILKVTFNEKEWTDGLEQEVTVETNGFPMDITFSGGFSTKNTYSFAVRSPVKNSANIRLKLFPNITSQIFNDLEEMMEQPSGCFEQTSSSNYPNIMALQYMRETGQTNSEIETKAMDFLSVGYKKLTGYECKNGGFEWFGKDPADEGLTAYGLMQFIDMKEVYPVSPLLINRTAKWLMSRRNENGGWLLNKTPLDSWIGSEEIYNAYITWAMTEAGYDKKIHLELDKAYNDAVKSEDVYVMALAANALINAKDKRGDKLLEDILLRQNEDGSWNGLKHSIVHSKAMNLTLETTSLVMLAMMKNKSVGMELQLANNFLMEQKSYNRYSNTQSTVLVLKAIIQYSKLAKKIEKGGRVIVYLNDKPLEKYTYSKDDKEDITLDNLIKDLPEGDYKLRVEFKKTKVAVPFEIKTTYATSLPPTDDHAPIALKTTLMKTSVNQGETVRLKVVISNNNNNFCSNPIAIVGIPSGASPQIWQLKKLQKEGVFDYYEIFNGYLVFYYRNLKTMEKKTINLDLKAETPGKYQAPASSAFLYYNAERKTWIKSEILEIL